MKLCFVCHGYPPAKLGGVEVLTQALARGLVAKGHAVWVVGYCDGYQTVTTDDDCGVQVVRLPTVKRGVFPAVLPVHLRLESAIRRLIREHGIELVECPDVGGSLLLGHFGVPLVVKMRGANIVYMPSTGRKAPRLTPFFEKRTLHLATHLLAVSKYIRDATLDAAGLHGRTCEVIYNGVDIHRFKPDPEIDRDPNRILFVGRLTETKGAPYLFRALPAIFERFPDAYLRFIGEDRLDREGVRASVRLLAELPESYRPKAEIVGQMPHEALPQECQRAAVAVFPSRAEALGMVALEAVRCGLPVIASRRPGFEELVVDSEAGVLVDDPEDADTPAEAILELLCDPEKAQRMGRASHIQSLEYLPEKINERFKRVVPDILSEG